MKIYIVCGKLNHGGAERVAVELANGFAKREHRVTIISDLRDAITYSLSNRILKCQLFTHSNKMLKWTSAIRNLRKYLKSDQPDVIIGIMPLCSLTSRISSLGLNIPIVATEHNSFERPASAPFSKWRFFEKFYLNKIYSHITVLTQADKDVVKGRLKPVTVMPNPLFLSPVKVIGKKEKVVLAAGRLDDWHYKGFDVLIKSWKKIQDLNDHVNDDDNLRDWWLKIAGIGTEESLQYLMNLLPDGEWKNLNDNDDDNKSAVWKSEKYRIEFLGFRKDIEELYKKSSIFALSSRYEGFGLVLIEAMSQGCAPVACDFKGRQREILNPSSALPEGEGEPNRKIEITENGILCEPDDVDALAAGLKKMIEDEKYREKVQRDAIERSKFYDIEHGMDRWEKYLNTVISRN